MSLRSLRASLVASLADALPEPNIYTHPPQAVNVPALVLVPDDPYLVPRSIGAITSAVVQFRLTLLVAINDNESALANIEDLAAAVFASIPNGYSVGDMTRPQPAKVGPAEYLSAEIPISSPTSLETD